MPYFLCRLAAEEGRILSESLLASSSEECRRHFESKGYCVLSIKRDWKKFKLSSLSPEKKIKDRDFITFNQEFMALVRAGYPVLRSIEIISGRAKNLYLKEMLRGVEDEIRQGKALSEAFTPFAKKFSTIYTASLMAGEQSGNLPETLSQFIQYAKVIARTKARIRSAMLYPTLILVFSLALLTILVNFVLPNFSNFYADFEAQLPIITGWLIGFALFVRDHWYIWIILIILIILAYFQMRRHEKTNLWLEKQKLRIPIGRGIWIESAASLFCRTLSLLVQAGVSLLSAVRLAIQAIPNKYLASQAAELPVNIKNGESLSESMVKAEFFPSLALDMVRIGETSANLGGMLKETADVYDERIQAKIDTFVSLIEPIIIIFMGLLVAAMLLSIYMPIFNIIKVAR